MRLGLARIILRSVTQTIMPTVSESEESFQDAPPAYFKTLSELDEWENRSKRQCRSDYLIPYLPPNRSHKTHGKLMVCHDYKGGYSESPSSLGYTFNFWNRCSTFIYFSHHRVTIPPPGWINAAHRQGCKMLGVLIFEHEESEEDALRLLIGKVPLQSTTGQVRSRPDILRNLPISKHYASVLANLSRDRGFDGYLLNFERNLTGRTEQVRAIEAWASILKNELERTVGSHAETVWYDSVVTTGEVRWQNRLNSRNINFFLASDSFFTNYWWPSPYPSICAQYLLSLDPDVIQDGPKALSDIYMGFDVWGRGSHGNGGLALYKAAEHIDPEFMGLSLAVFGPGWTWESDEGSPDWSWAKWWSRERTLWTGSEVEGATVEVPEWTPRIGEPPCSHGAFRPVSDFFPSSPPPDPKELAFYTSFSPGVGFAWFVEGERVMFKTTGWTDVDKQTSLGDLLWPRPLVSWDEQACDAVLPKGTNTVDFLDAFNGGSSLKVELRGGGAKTDENAFQCFWIPVQSLTASLEQLYEVQLVYKISSDDVDVDLALSAKIDTKASQESSPSLDVKPVSEGIIENFANGWSKASIICKASSTTSAEGSSTASARINIGMVLGTVLNDPTAPYTITIQLGQLSAFPKSSVQNAVPYDAKLLWADCALSSSPSSTPLAGGTQPSTDSSNSGSEIIDLSWDLTVSYTAPAILRQADLLPENPRPPWILDRSPQWFPTLLYANVYAGIPPPQISTGLGNIADKLDSKHFLGTSGAQSGGPTRFSISKLDLLKLLAGMPGVAGLRTRFYIQGVTDRGVALPWDKCAYVDWTW